MQTSKTTRDVSSEVPQKTSPATPRTARQLKKAGSDSDQTSSPNLCPTKKSRSPKVAERSSPRSTMTEKKRPSKTSELESQLAQLQEEYKKAKEQFNSTETSKKRAQLEAEETRKQLSSMLAKLEESQQQLTEISTSEDDRVQQLRKISQDRDRVWQSELDAVQKQHSMDTAALAAAMNEIKKLKKQLEMAAESESTQSRHVDSAKAEIQSLRAELTETVVLVEKMKTQLNERKEGESHAIEVATEYQMQLEAAKATVETLRLEGLKAVEAYTSLASELEQSKIQVRSLEKLVKELQEDLASNSSDNLAGVSKEDCEDEKSDKLRAEIDSLNVEICELRSALEASEVRYQEEYIQSTLQIRNAYDEVERVRSEASHKEAELKSELEKANATLEQLRSDISSKEAVFQSMCNENNDSESEPATVDLKKLEADLCDLKTALLDKEIQLQTVTEENEMLRMEIQKREMESCKLNEEAVAIAEAAKSAEREALMKLGYMTEEADKSTQKVTRVTEQLDAAQTVNTELESKLRRLKVQSDQWRKAAEAAAAMLTTGNNGKFVERTTSLDSSYHTIDTKMDSPLSDDLDDDSPKRKNGNMLKKFGVLWKKGQK